MPEEVLFKSEERLDRKAVAAHLRSVADKLDAGEALTLTSNGDELTLDVPASATFEVKAERETSKRGGPAELSVEFELEWTEGDDGERSKSGFGIK